VGARVEPNDINKTLDSATMIRRHRTIKFQTRNVTVIRAATETINCWCEECGAPAAMVTPERAAEMLMTNPRAIYQRVERGEVHFVETVSGELLICYSSLQIETRKFSQGKDKVV
jgi:hypothetical protein